PKANGLPAKFTLGVRPEHVQPRSEGEFSGEVVLLEPLGVETILHIKSGNKTLLSTVAGIARHAIGDQVRFDIVRDYLHYFDADGKRIKA
ncbi:MAG: TOBE domain-containing protein, partial [Ardenticatenia bacterium]|nr:TOBE domain-containing protein [Ardenticatenia bacterium]